MALDTGKQFLETINRAHHILITFRKEWNADAVASALALGRVLKAKGKQAEIVADGFAPTKNLEFLPGLAEIRSGFRQLQKFVISVDVKRSGIEELSYDLVGDKLKVFVTPKEGQFDSHDVTLSSSDFKYDLIVCIDTPDYAALGSLFSANTEFFYRRPVVNIDHDPSNERYGNLNVVDISASSAAEVLHDLLEQAGGLHLDEETATCLLTGMISKTRSFKTSRVTPRTLQVASDLIANGGRRDDIVRHLYRTRTLPTLKLWGRALARLKHDPVTRFAWTLLVRQDFIHAGTTEEALPDVLEELLVNSPEAEICGLLYEKSGAVENGRPGTICALICSEKHGDATGLVAALKPEGDRRLARICFPGGNLIEAEKAVLNTVYRSLGKTPPYENEAPTPELPELGHPDLIQVRTEAKGGQPTGQPGEGSTATKPKTAVPEGSTGRQANQGQNKQLSKAEQPQSAEPVKPTVAAGQGT